LIPSLETTRRREADSILSSAGTSGSEDETSSSAEHELARNPRQEANCSKPTRASWADLSEDADASTTTLMIRNIPPKYTQNMLLAEWENNGTYDLLYLPYSDKKKRNSGYAFVNFVSQAEAESFKNRWHGQRLEHFDRKKNLSVVPAEMQGSDSIIQNLFGMKASPSNRHGDVQPAIWKNRCGEQMEKVTLAALQV